MYLALNEVPNRTSTAKFATTQNRIRTHKSPILTTRRILPSSKTGSVVVVHRRRNACFLMCESDSFTITPCGWVGSCSRVEETCVWEEMLSDNAEFYCDFECWSREKYQRSWHYIDKTLVKAHFLRWAKKTRCCTSYCGDFGAFLNNTFPCVAVHGAFTLVAWWALVRRSLSCFVSFIRFLIFPDHSDSIEFSDVRNTFYTADCRWIPAHLRCGEKARHTNSLRISETFARFNFELVQVTFSIPLGWASSHVS